MFVFHSVPIFSLVDNVAKLGDLIQTDGGDRPQLLHQQRPIQGTSGFARFVTRLGLANRVMIKAVEKAHTFITSNYKPGDQVVLAVATYAKWETDYDAKSLDMLAWHLYNGTSPSNPSKAQLGAGGNSGRIPVHAVVAWVISDKKQSMSSWSDGWKMRLPPGIEHIICWEHYPFRSCSSAFDQDGTLTSRELRFSGYVRHTEFFAELTKHVLYHEQDRLPKWHEHPPVWTHVLDSSSREARGILPLESTKPAGMYHHELQSYQGLPGWGGDVSMVVLKAAQNGEPLES